MCNTKLLMILACYIAFPRLCIFLHWTSAVFTVIAGSVFSVIFWNCMYVMYAYEVNTSVLVDVEYPLLIIPLVEYPLVAWRGIIKSDDVQLLRTSLNWWSSRNDQQYFLKLCSLRYRPYHVNDQCNWDCWPYTFDKSRRSPHNVNVLWWRLVQRQCQDRPFSETDSKKFVDLLKYTQPSDPTIIGNVIKVTRRLKLQDLKEPQYHELFRNGTSYSGLCFLGNEDCIYWLL